MTIRASNIFSLLQDHFLRIGEATDVNLFAQVIFYEYYEYRINKR